MLHRCVGWNWFLERVTWPIQTGGDAEPVVDVEMALELGTSGCQWARAKTGLPNKLESPSPSKHRSA